jgi:hypothetical protein
MRWMVICEYEVQGGALNRSSTKLPSPWSPWESSSWRKNPHDWTGNRTRDLMISSQKLWPLDDDCGPLRHCSVVQFETWHLDRDVYPFSYSNLPLTLAHCSDMTRTLTLFLLMSYMYEAPCKARNFKVVCIWIYVWQRWKPSLSICCTMFQHLINTESYPVSQLCVNTLPSTKVTLITDGI